MTIQTGTARNLPTLDTRLTSVLRYWDEVRAGRTAPGRVELQPAAMARHLSRICVLERPRAGTIRMRLTGATISMRLGMELRGMPFRALFELDDRAFAMAAAEAAMTTPNVSLLSLSRMERTGATAEATMAILPLTDTRGALTRALAVYSERPSMTPYLSDIRGRFLVNGCHTLDIPEVGSILENAPLAERMRPQVRIARGVDTAPQDDVQCLTGQRPTFRVIEGGLA
ncbi:PAS domain-containing protein [Hasllibacter sp. MH4015]|uniref:PAS domain-containing protein n=1 Tax=Hasllibacter sp. MH4015 TaxID=2854029 RepID=UPI001CD51EA1|nr:PAS domain-containing protein [Hasllibacter sp. MH4015]